MPRWQAQPAVHGGVRADLSRRSIRPKWLVSGRLPFDRSDLDGSHGRKLALQERSNPAENNEVLPFDPHAEARVGWSKNGASVLEREEFVRAGDVDRQAIIAAFCAEFFGDELGMRDRHECLGDVFIHVCDSRITKRSGWTQLGLGRNCLPQADIRSAREWRVEKGGCAVEKSASSHARVRPPYKIGHE